MKVEKLDEVLAPILFDMGYELVDLEPFHQGGRWVLRVRIDRAGGVALDDCARVSRELGVHLDRIDPFQGPYSLEISSPGLDRPLKTTRDFERFAGRMVRVHTRHPLSGRSNWKGLLKEVQGDCIHVEVDRVMYKIPIPEVQKASLVP